MIYQARILNIKITATHSNKNPTKKALELNKNNKVMLCTKKLDLASAMKFFYHHFLKFVLRVIEKLKKVFCFSLLFNLVTSFPASVVVALDPSDRLKEEEQQKL